MKKIIILNLTLLSVFLIGCKNETNEVYSVNGVTERYYEKENTKFKSFGIMHLQNDSGEIIACPQEIALSAYEYAVKYSLADTVYEWGGQDPLFSISIDCSGLVVRCYQYAIKNTEYSLLFDDMYSSGFLNYSTPTDSPRCGDLVFMGASNSEYITHIAIFKEEKNGKIYFIDSTQF